MMASSEEEDHDEEAALEAPQPEYTPYRPFIVDLEYEGLEQPAYEPFSIPNGGEF
jgi:hypothetical protein